MGIDTAQIFNGEFWRGALEIIGARAWALAKILIFFLIVRFIAYRLIDRVMRTLIQRQTGTQSQMVTGRIRTLGSLFRSTIFYVLIFIVGVMILRVFDIDPTPVLAAAGVVGLAIGFGAQRLVRDIISGFFIVLENQYSVGDYITIGAVTGTVEEMGMRITHIRDDVGKLIMIANGDVTIVTNHSRGPILAILEIGVPADSDLERVRRAIDEVGKAAAESEEGIISPPKADGILAMDAARVTLRVCGEVKPGAQFEVQSVLREMLRSKFAEEEIKFL